MQWGRYRVGWPRRTEAIVVWRNLECLGMLTHREREILREVVTRGRLNKQIAFDLGISEVTVKLRWLRGLLPRGR
ncbi:FixJ family two-component response regulator [Rhizobium leguminosarum]|jgi:FixJ family two-component response regulator